MTTGTAKLTWVTSDRVTLKLKTAAGVVELNRDFETSQQPLPDGLVLFDTEGDAIANAAFLTIKENFSIQYKGVAYSFRGTNAVSTRPSPANEIHWRTPTKRVKEQLGLSDSEVASPNEAVNALFTRFADSQYRHRYTTQNESEIGKRIQEDNSLEGHSFKTEDLQLSFDLGGSIDASLLDVDPRSTSQTEDLHVNEPFQRVLSSVCKPSFFIRFTGQRSNLIDSVGREQRVDLVVLDSPYEEWASVVAVMEGKTDFSQPNWDGAVGQCMRRAKAILQAQPWRRKVVVPFYCISHIAFLEVEWSGPSRDVGYEIPRLSEKFPCLDATTEQGKVLVQGGFRALGAMLDNPSLFGFLPCPVSIDKRSLGTLGFKAAYPICFRQSQKAVFVAQPADHDQDAVIKVYLDRSSAESEHQKVAMLENVPGAISVHTDEVNELTLSWEGEGRTGFALVLSPYCLALTPSNASIELFGQYAVTLREAERTGLCNNDISPDNLLIHEGKGIIADWECGTDPGSEITRTTGKLLFCPYTEPDRKRTASLLGDLESLYYVAIAYAENGAAWVKHNSRVQEMLRDRQRYTGLQGRKSGSFKRWHSYLIGVRDALLDAKDTGDTRPVVAAFCRFDPLL